MVRIGPHADGEAFFASSLARLACPAREMDCIGAHARGRPFSEWLSGGSIFLASPAREMNRIGPRFGGEDLQDLLFPPGLLPSDFF